MKDLRYGRRTLFPMNEFELLAQIQRLGATAGAPRVVVPNGDDAVVIAAHAENTVLSVDAQVDNTHFKREWLSVRALGYRSAMAAFSDLAAMGAVPSGLLSSVQFARDVSPEDLLELSRGQAEACAELGGQVLGGNLSRGETLAVHTTVVGRVEGTGLTRNGARAGNVVAVAGQLGMAARGLAALLAGTSDAEGIAAWARPRAQMEAGFRARSVATAAIDVSDGLAQDVGHVAQASGVRIVLNAALLAPFAEAAGSLERVLSGGEDYALVITAPVLPEGFVCIGEVLPGEGVWLDNERLALDSGWNHGRR